MRRALIAIALCTLPASVQAQPQFPERAHQIVVELFNRQQPLAHGGEDDRRSLTKMMIEQIICDFPGQGYSWKSADPGRPPSKDTISKQDGGRFWAWDWQNGTTRQVQVHPGKLPDHDITGQNPIPLTCVNHLGSTTPPPPPGGNPPPPPSGETDEAVAELRAEFRAFRVEVREQWIKEEAERMQLAKTTHETLGEVQQHRAEVRKGRNAVLGWLTNWRNLATIAGSLGAFEAARRATDDDDPAAAPATR